MKKFIFMLLTLCVLPHATHCKEWDKEKRNICIALAVVGAGYLGYRYYSSDSTPVESNTNKQNEEEPKKVLEEHFSAQPKTNKLEEITSAVSHEKKDNNKPILDTPTTTNHSDLAKKIHQGLEEVCANIHHADIEAIFAHNLGILEG